MTSRISFLLDDRLVSLDFHDPSCPGPTTTILNYLRSLPNHKGVKEGCAEGDCGACTVVLGELDQVGKIRYKSVDSCLAFLPMLHRKNLITVENLADAAPDLHPVQQAMVDTNGSQCGYCTPGFIMSLFSLYKNSSHPSQRQIDDALTGNLCRCTGYRPIVQAAATSCVHEGRDKFSEMEAKTSDVLQSVAPDTLHVKTRSQEYFRPLSLTEALAFKRQHPDALFISGATDVALRVTKRHEVLASIIDLSGIDELSRVTDSTTSLRIGAGVTMNEMMTHCAKDFAAIHSILSVFGSQQIRNLATIGGNLGTASPIGDTLPLLIAYDAKVALQSLLGKREVPIDDFFTGYRQTVRKPDELVTAVILPKMGGAAAVRAYKVSKRKDLDISTVSGGFRIEVDELKSVGRIKLAYGGMADRPKRASTVEKYLTGKTWSREIVEQGMALVEKDFSPISDARAGAEFRMAAARNLLLKFWSDTSGDGA